MGLRGFFRKIGKGIKKAWHKTKSFGKTIWHKARSGVRWGVKHGIPFSEKVNGWMDKAEKWAHDVGGIEKFAKDRAKSRAKQEGKKQIGKIIKHLGANKHFIKSKEHIRHIGNVIEKHKKKLIGSQKMIGVAKKENRKRKEGGSKDTIPIPKKTKTTKNTGIETIKTGLILPGQRIYGTRKQPVNDGITPIRRGRL